MRPRVPDDKGMLSRVYGWFLELPPLILLLVMWLAGAVLIGLGALALYQLWLLL
jgi:hypothetical protein